MPCNHKRVWEYQSVDGTQIKQIEKLCADGYEPFGVANSVPSDYEMPSGETAWFAEIRPLDCIQLKRLKPCEECEKNKEREQREKPVSICCGAPMELFASNRFLCSKCLKYNGIVYKGTVHHKPLT